MKMVSALTAAVAVAVAVACAGFPVADAQLSSTTQFWMQEFPEQVRLPLASRPNRKWERLADLELLALFTATPGLMAKTLRLAFHDCGETYCDGCIEWWTDENRGLQNVVQVLNRRWVLKGAKALTDSPSSSWMSRADYWQRAAIIAMRHGCVGPRPGMIGDPAPSFEPRTCPVIDFNYGRVDFAPLSMKTGNFGVNNGNEPSAHVWADRCATEPSEIRHLPPAGIIVTELLDNFFQDMFPATSGMDDVGAPFGAMEKMVCLVSGAHSMGGGEFGNSGHGGKWTPSGDEELSFGWHYMEHLVFVRWMQGVNNQGNSQWTVPNFITGNDNDRVPFRNEEFFMLNSDITFFFNIQPDGSNQGVDSSQCGPNSNLAHSGTEPKWLSDALFVGGNNPTINVKSGVSFSGQDFVTKQTVPERLAFLRSVGVNLVDDMSNCGTSPSGKYILHWLENPDVFLDCFVQAWEEMITVLNERPTGSSLGQGISSSQWRGSIDPPSGISPTRTYLELFFPTWE